MSTDHWLDREAADAGALEIPCQEHSVLVADLILCGDHS